MNTITMQLVADQYIRMALQEDIHSEDVTTNAVMPEYKLGEVNLICKEDGVIAGLDIFARVFTLLDPATEITFFVKDGFIGSCQRGYSRIVKWRAYCIKLSSKNERYRNIHKKCSSLIRR